MADNAKVESSSADQLLSFVSNASRELKDMLGRVDSEDCADHGMNLLSPGLNLRLSSTPSTSPIPSPTPSCVSSLSDQEVPSMSPGLFARTTQRRVRRKRSLDLAGEKPLFDFSAKYRRADSVGDYEDYYPNCAVLMRQQGGEISPMEVERTLHQQAYRKSNNPHYDHINSVHNSHQQLYNRPMQKLHMHNYASSAFLLNHQNHTMQTFDHQNCGIDVRPQEPTPDFADLVSWMLAEDFLDAETLGALLSHC